MKAWLEDNHEVEIIDKEHIVVPEPEGNAIEAARTQLFSIERECRDRFGVQEFSAISVILSGPGNYREQIATIFPYKGNRDPEHKPHWYQSIRDYLSSDWGAVVVHGREADDECSILARRDRIAKVPYIIATIDKDLEQIPGQHYNYLKQVHYAQSEYAARLWFFTQCISGDPTDGIPGCYRVGSVGAARLASELFPAESVHHRAAGRARKRRSRVRRSDGQHMPSAVWDGIVAAYATSQERAGCPYVGSDPAAVALEQARLVYLQQAEGELWIPEGPPHLQLELDD